LLATLEGIEFLEGGSLELNPVDRRIARGHG
jgi:hypothetical protein